MAIRYIMYGENGITQSPTEYLMAGGGGTMGSPLAPWQPPALGGEAGETGANRFSRPATPLSAPSEAAVAGEGEEALEPLP